MLKRKSWTFANIMKIYSIFFWKPRIQNSNKRRVKYFEMYPSIRTNFWKRFCLWYSQIILEEINYLHKSSWKLTSIDPTYTNCDAIGARVNGITLSKSLNLFKRSLNLSTWILAFAILLQSNTSSFVNFSRFPKNGGM